MALPFEVHAWPCSVSVGDAAIHLLVDINNKALNKQGKIQRAVLIDGGTYTDHTNELYALIAWINNNYEFADNAGFDDASAPAVPAALAGSIEDLRKKQLRFDSVVITHWDRDHYLGVKALVERGTQDYIACVTADIVRNNGDGKAAEFRKAFLEQCRTYSSPEPDLVAVLGEDVKIDPAALGDDDVLKKYQQYDAKLNAGGKGQQPRVQAFRRMVSAVYKAGRQKSPPLYYDVFEGTANSTDPISVKCRYLKYGTGYQSNCADIGKPLPAVDNTAHLLSTLYVPYPVNNRTIGPHSGEQTDASARPSTDSSTDVFCVHKDYDANQANCLGYIFAFGPYTLSIPFDSELKTDTHTYPKPSALQVVPLRSTDLCKVVATFAEYIGTELFFQTPITQKEDKSPSGLTWQTAANPLSLVTAKGMTKATGPRMFFVAGDQRIISDRPLTNASDPILPWTDFSASLHQPANRRVLKPSWRPRELVVNAPDGHIGRLPARPRDSYRVTKADGRSQVDDTIKNSASLVSITLAVTSDAVATTASDVKMCYYSGGDVTWDVEGSLAQWISGGQRTTSGAWSNGTQRYQIDVLKMSHHGSRDETSLNLMEVLHPRFIVASNPSGQVFGHPTLEVAVLMDAYRVRMLDALQQATLAKDVSATSMRYTPPFICLNQPWFFREGEYLAGKTTTNISAMKRLPDSTSGPSNDLVDAIKAFQGALMSLYGNTGDNIFVQWNNECAANLAKTLSPDEVKTGLVVPLIHKVMFNWDQNSIAGRTTHIHGVLFRLDSLPFDATVPWKHRLWNSVDGIREFPPAVEYAIAQTASKSSDEPPTITRTMARTFSNLYLGWNNPKEPKLVRTTAEGNVKVKAKKNVEKKADEERRMQQEKLDREAKSSAQKTKRAERRTNLAERKEQEDKVEKPALKKPRGEAPSHEAEEERFVRRAVSTHLVAREHLSSASEGHGHDSLPPLQPVHVPPTPAVTLHTSQTMAPANSSNDFAVRSDTIVRATAPASGAPFFLYCSDFDTAQLPPNGGILDGADTNVFNTWLRSTAQGLVVLDRLPDDTSSPLNATDHWLQVLQASSLGIVRITIGGKTVSVDGHAQCTVSSISANLQLGTALSLSFSSDATKTVMSPPQIPNSSAKSDYFQDDFSILELGLATGVDQVSLKTAIAAVGPAWLGKVMDILQLGDDFNFRLDASSGSRSSLSFLPDDAKTSILRLRFGLAADNSFLDKLLNVLPLKGVSFNKDDTAVTLLRASRCNNPSTQSTLRTAIVSKAILETSISFTSKTSSIKYTVSIAMSLSTDRIETTFRFQNGTDSSASIKDALEDILEWLFTTVDLGDGTNMSGDPKSLFPSIGSVDIDFQQVSVVFSLPGAKGEKLRLEKLEVHLEIKLWGSVFQTSVMYPCFQLQAVLLKETPKTFADLNLNMLPWWEPFELVVPNNAANASVDITKTPFGSAPPAGLQTDLEDAELLIQVAPFTAYFAATIQIALPSPGDMPFPFVDTLSIRALYAGSQTPSTGSATWNINVDSQFFLYPRDYNPELFGPSPAMVDIDASISDSEWTISLHVWSLDFATIYDLFDANAQESVMDILEHLWISEFSLTYVHPKGSPGRFSAIGILELGPIDLEIDYNFDQATRDWSFEASIDYFTNDGHQPLTVVHLLEALVKPDPAASFLEFLDDIPFIRDIAIPSAASDGGDPPLMLSVQKSENAIVVWFMVRIQTSVGMFHLTLIQTTPTRASQSPLNNEKPDPGVKGVLPKRVLRLKLDSLPSIGPVPVVGMIDQPVEALEYLLVLDENKAKTSGAATAGLTAAEVDAINATLPMADALQYKAIAKTGSAVPANTPPPMVLLAGHHFIALSGGRVILDHVFGKGSTPDASTNGNSNSSGDEDGAGGGTSKASGQTAATADTGTTLAPTKKTLRGLAIDNFGLKCKDDYLYLMLDAKVMLGPIELDLVGFGVGLPLAKIANWKSLTIDDFRLTIKGIGVDFNQPPIAIAGFFEKNSTDLFEEYLGGLMVSILPYTLVAVGAYRHTFTPDFKSVFVFASLDGPLVSLEFAEISGVAAGFGYQYNLRLPDVGSVQNFPFVHGQQSETNPMALMSTDTTSPSNFNNWITARQDTLFFAVGMKVDSFEVLSVDAALIVGFDGPYPKFALVGIASASMPPTQTKKPEAFVYVEMGIVAALDTLAGTFVVGAQLTNNSYIIYPDVHLTGGMALCYWFGASPHAGDWVFTIGGYHPAYSKPDHYPVVPRVGISWNLSDVLTIRGEAYFAVTPKCAMAGGRLLAVLSAGPIYASLEAWANFMVNFRPFFFIADIGICITVGFHIDIGIIHIHFDGHLGATLHLQGPAFGGVAHVDFSLHPFDVYFGHQPDPPPPLSWDDTGDTPGFLSLVKQPGPNTTSDAKDMAVLAINDGAAAASMAASTARDTGEAWFVRAGQFRWRLDLKFPVDVAVVSDGVDDWIHDGGSGGLSAVTPSDLDASVSAKVQARSHHIYARPMQHAQPCVSVVHINVIPPDVVKIPQPWRVQAVARDMPNAIWAAYDPSQDPMQGELQSGTLLSNPDDKGTTPLTTSFLFTKPRSVWPKLEIPPFNALKAMFEDVFADVDNPTLPPNGTAQTSNTLTNDWASAEAAIKSSLASAADSQELVEDIASLLGWTAALTTEYPQMLMDHFEDNYLECPWVS